MVLGYDTGSLSANGNERKETATWLSLSEGRQ
jgi:hypothetical protein